MMSENQSLAETLKVLDYPKSRMDEQINYDLSFSEQENPGEIQDADLDDHEASPIAINNIPATI